mgnify:CR=1 FL=1
MKKTYVALGAILTVMAPATLTAQEVTLRLSHWVPPTISPATKGINPWAESVMEASDGRIQIDIYPAQQLGRAGDGLRRGLIGQGVEFSRLADVPVLAELATEVAAGGAEAEQATGRSIQYRVPTMATLDGNTVEMATEQAAFAENAVAYSATLNFLRGRVETVTRAIRGE